MVNEIKANQHKCLYTIKDLNGFLALKNSDGYRAQPFW